MKKIYISGRISGLTMEEATAKFAEAEKMLNDKGWECINPITLVPFDPKLDWVDYMVKDIEAILRDCDRVYMLDNWGQSRGARIERAIAIEEGMKVYYSEKDVPDRARNVSPKEWIRNVDKIISEKAPTENSLEKIKKMFG